MLDPGAARSALVPGYLLSRLRRMLLSQPPAHVDGTLIAAESHDGTPVKLSLTDKSTAETREHAKEAKPNWDTSGKNAIWTVLARLVNILRLFLRPPQIRKLFDGKRFGELSCPSRDLSQIGLLHVWNCRNSP